jgi:hypothetical protein
MNEHDHGPFLQARLEGESIGAGRIPVSHLLILLKDLNKAFYRSGLVMSGEADSVRRGARPKSVKDEIALDLVLLTHGSEATVLGFSRRQTQQSLLGMEIGREVFEKSLAGLDEIQKEGEALPTGFDSGVLLAWRDVGLLFQKGVKEIRFTLNGDRKPFEVSYSREGYERVQERIVSPQVRMRTIEGRLLMADFKEHGTRCRIHPSTGQPVLCLFTEDQRDEVLENILHYVRVIGEAKEDPETGRITGIKLADIQRLEDREDAQEELLPVGTPLPTDFWTSATIEELAQAQSVEPLADVTALFGTWPGEADDGFEVTIRSLRNESLAGESRS